MSWISVDEVEIPALEILENLEVDETVMENWYLEQNFYVFTFLIFSQRKNIIAFLFHLRAN
jgi:hypothetical protein